MFVCPEWPSSLNHCRQHQADANRRTKPKYTMSVSRNVVLIRKCTYLLPLRVCTCSHSDVSCNLFAHQSQSMYVCISDITQMLCALSISQPQPIHVIGWYRTHTTIQLGTTHGRPVLISIVHRLDNWIYVHGDTLCVLSRWPDVYASQHDVTVFLQASI